MAIITKNSTSGNWNSTSSWVGGVVPTSVDDVIFDATSAGVVLNVASTVKSIDMTGFTGTFTQSADFAVAGATNSSGVSWTAAPNMIMAGGYAWTAGALLGALSRCGYKQLDTTARFVLEYIGQAATTYLYSDWHIGPGRFTGNTALVHNGFSIKITSLISSSATNKLYLYGSGGTNTGLNVGTYSANNVVIDINDTIFLSGDFINCGIQLIQGTISSSYASLGFGEQYGTTGILFRATATTHQSSFTKTGGNFDPKMQFGVAVNLTRLDWNCDDQVPYFVMQPASPSAGYNGVINCITPLNVKHLMSEFSNTFNTNSANAVSATQFQRYLFSGPGGLSASNYIVKSTVTKVSPNNSSGNNNINGLPLVPRVPSLRFSSDATHKIANFVAIGMTTDVMTEGYGSLVTLSNVYGTFSSQTASVPATIQLGNMGLAWRYGFQDLNFTGNTMYAINGTLTNTTGAIASYPSVGGGGGAFTFVN